MGAIPTITLKHTSGSLMKVNAHDYALDISGYIARGYKIVNETDLGKPPDIKKTEPAAPASPRPAAPPARPAAPPAAAPGPGTPGRLTDPKE